MKIAIIGRTEVLYETALIILEAGYEIPLIVTAREAPEYKKTAKDFEELAAKINATFINTTRISSLENIESISQLEKIDVGVSMNYVSVINREVIDLFALGILNAHSGDLPKYRGNACQAWAIINGEEKIGLCIHKMLGGELDSGDIIVRNYFPININTKIRETYEWMASKVPQMFLDAIRKLEKNPSYILEVQSKKHQEALRCYPRIPADGRLNWQDSNEEILRLINASSEPYAGAFCYYDEQKVIIWDAELHNDQEVYLAVPGQISQINLDGSIIVICGRGKLKINELELNGIRTNPSRVTKSIRKRFV